MHHRIIAGQRNRFGSSGLAVFVKRRCALIMPTIFRTAFRYLAQCGVIILLTGSLAAAEPSTAEQLFADGSVVTLIGDSITHGGSWHRSVAEYCATRFPERSIRFWNGGIAGDSAGGVLTRLEKDILIQRPNAAVVLLGMNDVRSWLYKNGAESDPQVAEKRRQAHADYVKNIGVLVDRLQREGIHPIVLMTPSPYDETAQIAR